MTDTSEAASPAEPIAEHPVFPTGYVPLTALPWAWAEKRLVEALVYWFASSSDTNRPYIRPLWGAWHDNALWFRTGSRLATYFAARPEVSIHTDGADDVVILDGVVSGPWPTPPPVVAVLTTKYANNPNVDPAYVFRPTRAYGWTCDSSGEDGGIALRATATRWRFPTT